MEKYPKPTKTFSGESKIKLLLHIGLNITTTPLNSFRYTQLFSCFKSTTYEPIFSGSILADPIRINNLALLPKF